MIESAIFVDAAKTTIAVVDNGQTLFVPADSGNRHYLELQKWEAAGNKIGPFVATVYPAQTKTEKLDAMLAANGLTVADLKDALKS